MNDSVPAGDSGPFTIGAFRVLWLIALVANLCSLTQTVAAAWAMTQFESASLVALVQTAMTLPVMLFAIPAGTLADLSGRSQILLAAFWLMFVAAGISTLMSLFGALSPTILLASCFLFGCGAALFGPTVQAAVGDSVPTALMPEAVASIGISYNLARCIGPAVGGILIAVVGPTATYAINCLCALAMVFLVLRKLHAPARFAEPRSFSTAISQAIGHVGHSFGMRVIVFRAAIFAAAGSSVWALMPLIAREQLGGGAATYGLLMSAMGAGAIAFAFNIRMLRAHIGFERIVQGFTGCGAIGLLLLPHMTTLPTAMIAVLAMGASWTATMTVWSVSSQLCAPRRLAGRAVGTFHTAMFGGMAGGSWVWGHIAETLGMATSLTVSGIAVAATMMAGLRWPVPEPLRDLPA